MTSITGILLLYNYLTYFHSSSLRYDRDFTEQGKKYLLNFDVQSEPQN